MLPTRQPDTDASKSDFLVFHEYPVVRFASCVFREVPVILQYEETPLVEVMQGIEKHFTTRIPIFHPDGTQLAVAEGARLHLTKEGEKARLVLRQLARQTVCSLDGRVLFELARQEAASVAITAELFTQDGRFVRVHDGLPPSLFTIDDKGLTLPGGNLRISGGVFERVDIGLLVKANGSVQFAVRQGRPGWTAPGDFPSEC